MQTITELFSKKLLAWFEEKGRKDLPWQINKTPYRVWVSEIMLQQTQVATVIAYYERFMSAFPTIENLSKAHEDEVLHLWTGLGYYTRARNLHRTAKIIFEKFNGVFPNTLAALETLPGIGKSTAAAILSIAFNQKATILDGNVKRVLTRFYALHATKKELEKQLWPLAETLTPDHHNAEYTQAIMDLGATICTRTKPACSACPMNDTCEAHKQGIASLLPIKTQTNKTPTRAITLLIIKNNNDVLLEKRVEKGVWQNLWSFPQLTELRTLAEAKIFCERQLHLKTTKLLLGQTFRHIFSHYQLTILPIYIEVKKSFKISEGTQKIWYDIHHPATIGLPGPIQKILSELAQQASHTILSEQHP